MMSHPKLETYLNEYTSHEASYYIILYACFTGMASSTTGKLSYEWESVTDIHKENTH